MKFIKYILVFCCSQQPFSSHVAIAQEASSESPSGSFYLGVRSAVSWFASEGKSYFGIASGGQIRMRISEQLNSDWYGISE